MFMTCQGPLSRRRREKEATQHNKIQELLFLMFLVVLLTWSFAGCPNLTFIDVGGFGAPPKSGQTFPKQLTRLRVSAIREQSCLFVYKKYNKNTFNKPTKIKNLEGRFILLPGCSQRTFGLLDAPRELLEPDSLFIIDPKG